MNQLMLYKWIKREFDAEYKGMFDYDELNKTYNEEHPNMFRRAMTWKKKCTICRASVKMTQMYEEMMDAYDKGEEGLAKHLGMSDKELDMEIDEW